MGRAEAELVRLGRAEMARLAFVWVARRRRRWRGGEGRLGRAEAEDTARRRGSFGSCGDGAFGVRLGRVEVEEMARRRGSFRSRGGGGDGAEERLVLGRAQ